MRLVFIFLILLIFKLCQSKMRSERSSKMYNAQNRNIMSSYTTPRPIFRRGNPISRPIVIDKRKLKAVRPIMLNMSPAKGNDDAEEKKYSFRGKRLRQQATEGNPQGRFRLGFRNVAKKNGNKGITQVEFEREKIRGYNETNGTIFNIETGYNEGDQTNPKSRMRCKTVTNAVIGATGGKTGSSKGYTYSEVPSSGKKSLVCQSETSETIQANPDVIIRHSVVGQTVVTNENPNKYLDRGYLPSDDVLEVGSSSKSNLKEKSDKNQSSSVVGSHDKHADSSSQTRSKFVYDKDGRVSAIDTASGIEGSTGLARGGKKPFTLSSTAQEASMIVQNPKKNLEKKLRVEDGEDVKTYMDYSKKTNFDIAFRSLGPKLRRRKRVYHSII